MRLLKSYFLLFSLFSLLSTSAAAQSTLYLDEMDLSKATQGYKTAQKNLSVEGRTLTIAGQTFKRGYGGHSQGCLTIQLDGKAKKFSAWVGIDEEKGGDGYAEFRIVGDGKDLWKSEAMTGKHKAKFVEVKLDGVKKLDLMMDLGPDGHYGCDHMDWCDAKFEYAGQKPVTIKASRAGATNNGKPRSSGTPGQSSKSIKVNTKRTDRALNLDEEIEWQWKTLTEQLQTGMRPEVIEQAFHPDSCVYKGKDRDALDITIRRVGALIKHLSEMKGGPKLEAEKKAYAAIVAKAEKIEPTKTDERKELFTELSKLKRKISFQNPLLNFNKILFLKRHFLPNAEKMGNHMCDQFFGFHARPGGGLFVLDNPFGEKVTDAKATNLLENAVIAPTGGHGDVARLAGKKLDSKWGFLSPDLSFDGKKIIFAAADTTPDRHTYTWTTDNCYHLFEVVSDGKNLKQLTDGPRNDFDPCFMPNGRVIFISERRGGYGRCHGRPVPSFTLHSMNADATDIVTLSPHETNEWGPSVDNAGMIIYTRWDYVDRGFNQAHHPWITSPDGRDARALHGNFAENQRHRPHFEVGIRAIPGSQKISATAACHHGQVYGSLVIVDPKVEDDDKMAQVRRITPDQLFPEAECPTHRGPADYSTAWPLSEEFYLCVWDPASKSNMGIANNYGIYLIDAFGNRELLYRDPLISCHDVIPMLPRTKPPVIPHATLVGKPLKPGEKFVPIDPSTLPTHADVLLMDVYKTRLPFPEGTKIKQLRIIQLLPKTTPHANNPRVGFGSQKSARGILGTVPVEKDGSAHFRLPVNIPVYFQALDESGRAVQSMRSATYIHPGEKLVCTGCHERRYDAPDATNKIPMAMKRSASDIQPEVDGTLPFSYPRLVQPVLDKYCVECHTKKKAMDLSAKEAEKKGGKFFTSYNNLKKYAFYFDNAVFTTPRTIPGEFGAKKAPLGKVLDGEVKKGGPKGKGHAGILPPAERHKIDLWLDSNSDFFGSYENLKEQSQGEIVQPTMH